MNDSRRAHLRRGDAAAPDFAPVFARIHERHGGESLPLAGPAPVARDRVWTEKRRARHPVMRFPTRWLAARGGDCSPRAERTADLSFGLPVTWYGSRT